MEEELRIASDILKNNELFNFLEREIKYGTPTPIPFIIATAIVKNIPIVIDESDKDYIRFKKIADKYQLLLLNKNTYIKALRNQS